MHENDPLLAARLALVDAIRRANHLVMETDAPEEVLREAAADIERANDAMRAHPGPRPAEFGLGFNDLSPIQGRFNPMAPPITFEVGEGEVRGTGVFGPVHEGPRGTMHGGIVAALFDDLLAIAMLNSEQQGPTGSLTVRLKRPVPLHKDLHLRARVDRIEGRRIHTEGTIEADGVVVAEGEAVFIGPKQG